MARLRDLFDEHPVLIGSIPLVALGILLALFARINPVSAVGEGCSQFCLDQKSSARAFFVVMSDSGGVDVSQCTCANGASTRSEQQK